MTYISPSTTSSAHDMSTPDPSSNPPGTPPPSGPGHNAQDAPLSSTAADQARWNSLFYNSSLSIVVAAPLIALLPPRKLDLYTFGLGIAWCMSAGFVVEQKTGNGLLWHIGTRLPSEGNRRRIREEKEAEMRWRGERVAPTEEKERKRGLLKSIWMGGESDDWVEERKRREQEALDEGRGYSGLIMDQVKDVFGTTEPDMEEEQNDGKGK